MPNVILAPQRRESGGERQGGETLWNGYQHLEEVYLSGSMGKLPRFINKSTADDAPGARDEQEFSPYKPNDVQSLKSQNEQRRAVFQKSSKPPKGSGHAICRLPAKPPGSLQGGSPENSRFASSNSIEAERPKEPVPAHATAEKEHQEGRVGAGYLINSEPVQMRSGSSSGSTLRSFTTESLASFRRKKLEPWPNPEDSLGDMIETKNKKIKHKVWVAQGEALKLFNEQIRQQIEELLHHIEPPQCAPLFLTLYMIGKTETSASPIIMISCCDRKVRKDAESTIRENDILQRFPHVGLGSSATLLEANSSLVTSAGRVSASYMDDQNLSRFEIHWNEEPVIGRRLRLVEKADGREIVRLATGGPFVQIENHLYQLTAFHIGQGDASTTSDVKLDSDDDDCTYDGQSDTDEDGSDLEETTAKDAPSEDSISTELETDFTSLSMAHHKTDVPLTEHDGQDAWSSRSLLHPRNIDYFLARLPAGDASKASNVIETPENHHSLQITKSGTPKSRTQVVVVTSYSVLTGTILPGTNRVKLHGFQGFQDLLTARLSSSIKAGDSGSAVFDATTGRLYGHIILGSAPDTIVYIVPSTSIFDNILAIFGKPAALNFTAGLPDPSKTLQVRNNGPRPGSQLSEHVSTGKMYREAKSITAAKVVGSDPVDKQNLLLKSDKTSPLGAREAAPREHSSRFRNSDASRNTDGPSRFSRATMSNPMSTYLTGYEGDASRGRMWSTQQLLLGSDTKTSPYCRRGQHGTVSNHNVQNRSNSPPANRKRPTGRNEP